MANLTIAYPLRGWLDFMLREMLLTLAVPVFNQEILNRIAVDEGAASQPGFVLPKLTENTVTLGELHSLEEMTLSIVPGANAPAGGAPTNTAYRTLTTRFLWKIPKAGLNRPEDFQLVKSTFDDLFTNLLLDDTRYVLTPVDPANNGPALPGGASFTQCLLGPIIPMPMPVRMADKVTYVDGGYCDFICFFELAYDRPGLIG